MSDKQKRFVVYKEPHGISAEAKIIMDSRTGAHYLFFKDGYAGGLTPLLGSDGRPYIQMLDASDGADEE